MKRSTLYILQALIAAIPLLYLAFQWDLLPQRVPVHFDIEGKPDRMGNKSELVLVGLVMFVIAMATSLLINNLHIIDPKRAGHQHAGIFTKLSWVLVIFLSVISVFIIQSATAGELGEGGLSVKFMLVIIAVFLAVLGNFMNNVKPNYFVGIRTPWTLNDENNWRATHRLAAKLWFIGGLVIAALVLLLPPKAGFWVFLPGVLIISFVPMIYSYLYFRKNMA